MKHNKEGDLNHAEMVKRIDFLRHATVLRETASHWVGLGNIKECVATEIQRKT